MKICNMRVCLVRVSAHSISVVITKVEITDFLRITQRLGIGILPVPIFAILLVIFALARMVLDDHTAPKEYDEAYAYECAYKSLLLGGDTLATVVQGYRNGFLTSHAADHRANLFAAL